MNVETRTHSNILHRNPWYRRFIPLLSLYRGSILISIICQIGVAIFTVVSIPAFIPFIRVIFGLDSSASTTDRTGFIYWVNSSIEHWTEGNSKLESLGYICSLLILIFFIKNIFRYGASYFLAPVRTGVMHDIRSELYEYLMGSTLSFQQSQRRGDIMSRLSADVAEVEWSIMNTLEVIFRQPIIISGCLLFMLVVSVKLTLIVIVLMGLLALLLGLINKRLRKSSGNAQQLQGELLSRVDETLDGVRVIRAYNADQATQSLFEKINRKYADTLKRVLQRRDLASPLSEFIGVSIFASLLWIGSQSVFSGEMGAETFFAFLIAFFYIIEPAKALAQAQSHINKGLGALDRIDALNAAPQEEIIKGRDVITFKERIEFKNVTFKYSSAKTLALDNISFTINKGEHVALVGASGSGKSTVADLLARFYNPLTGEILMDGLSMKHISRSSWRKQIGLVTQHPVLFHASIKENIAMFSESYTAEEIKQACQQAYAHEFIQQLPDGYDTVLGDRGATLSGGERQRIALARAILSGAPVLILDEATSALDGQSELFIQQALTGPLRDRTALIIAHRQSTIQHCDKVLELKEGKLKQ